MMPHADRLRQMLTGLSLILDRQSTFIPNSNAEALRDSWDAPKQKSHRMVAKLLIDMVGDTWIEHVTPAV